MTALQSTTISRLVSTPMDALADVAFSITESSDPAASDYASISDCIEYWTQQNLALWTDSGDNLELLNNRISIAITSASRQIDSDLACTDLPLPFTSIPSSVRSAAIALTGIILYALYSAAPTAQIDEAKREYKSWLESIISGTRRV